MLGDKSQPNHVPEVAQLNQIWDSVAKSLKGIYQYPHLQYVLLRAC